jgi:hypothetical protein
METNLNQKSKKEIESILIDKIKQACNVNNIYECFFCWRNNKVIQIEFRLDCTISLKVLQSLADAMGTDAINFNFGNSGEPGYSSYTPGTSGTPGNIVVLFKDEEWKKNF